LTALTTAEPSRLERWRRLDVLDRIAALAQGESRLIFPCVEEALWNHDLAALDVLGALLDLPQRQRLRAWDLLASVLYDLSDARPDRIERHKGFAAFLSATEALEDAVAALLGLSLDQFDDALARVYNTDAADTPLAALRMAA
jgi:hypothetical protein